MSAFIVGERTMHRVLWAIDKARRGGAMSCEQLDDLGRQLYQLNARAVACRYNEAPETDFDGYRYSPVAPTDVQALKSVQCFIYQCSEGEQFEADPLYVELREIERQTMARIISHMPEYDRAAWDEN